MTVIHSHDILQIFQITHIDTYMYCNIDVDTCRIYVYSDRSQSNGQPSPWQPRQEALTKWADWLEPVVHILEATQLTVATTACHDATSH